MWQRRQRAYAAVLTSFLVLLLGSALLPAAPVSGAAQSAPAREISPVPSDDSLAELKTEARGRVRISREEATGKVGFLRVAPGGDLFPDSDAGPRAKAEAYLREHGDAFGADLDQLVRTSVASDDLGTTVGYTQRYRDLPVFGSELKVHLDADGSLIAVNGFVVPDLDLVTTPELSDDHAAEIALAEVYADPPKPVGEPDRSVPSPRSGSLRASERELVVYRLGSLRGVPGESVLVWRVVVTDGAAIGEQLFVTAESGKIVNRYSVHPEALNRTLFQGSSTVVWREGDPLPGTLTAEQERVVRSTGDAYWFFKNAFGRDSFDNAGRPMNTWLNRSGTTCPNAFWDGTYATFCAGVSSDDVVAHEWAHAYTEYTANLEYQFQSGALNEAYSDIWGETIDLINAREDDEEGDLATPRPVGSCTPYSPVLPLVSILQPAAIASDCLTAEAAFGPAVTAAGITANVIAAVDASGDPADGCSPYVNAASTAGELALVNRSTSCSFVTQATNAQAAGATGLIVANSTSAVTFMAGTGPAITIPTVMITQPDGQAIRGALGTGPVQVKLSDAAGARADSYRWLLGEDASALGGAIRDMWSPTCFGYAGKISDAEYYCGTDDNGGVHLNSSVPNHAYALLVDGGTYNGVAVAGLGLDKAAAIHFRAQSTYLTPTSDFGDQADALLSACTDLIGQPLTELTVAASAVPSATAPLSASDCDSVTAVINATQLRLKPSQCGVLLEPNAPAAECGTDYDLKTVFSENFTDLEGWTKNKYDPYPGGVDWAWRTVTTDPTKEVGVHPGSVAFAQNTNVGDCSGGSGDVTGRDSLSSPEIYLPPDGTSTELVNPILSFEHYVATEAGYDGGNVKISLNYGSYFAVPASAYTFNPMNTVLRTSGNSNPLAGQPAFSGSDGGVATGSWGESQIDLAALGVVPGDVMRVMFDFGRDGCFGNDGWYVDNVELTICAPKPVAVQITATRTPEPTVLGTASRLDVLVTQERTDLPVPSGKVYLAIAEVLQASAPLVNGRASFSLPSTLPGGTLTASLFYEGSGIYQPRLTSVLIRVTKSTTEITAKPVDKRVKFKANFYVRAKVTGNLPPNGMVKIYHRQKFVAWGEVKAGLGRIKVRKDLKPGRYKLRAEFRANSSFKKSEDYFRIRILRRTA